MSGIVLHGYWRSSAAYRVRIALNLKGMDYRQVTHDLRQGAQRSPDYLKLAPQGLVPALEVDGTVLTQSPAILEWIDARWPEPRLIPPDRDDAVVVRAMAAIVGCDIHPINNLRVLERLRGLGLDKDAIREWIGRWIGDGFFALETMIVRHGGRFAFADEPTIADCYLVPQVYAARRFDVDLSAFPRVTAAAERAAAIPAFEQAHPTRQPDADG